MVIDQEARRNCRRNLFGSVGELADIEHQRATWLDPEMQNPHFGFVEFFECFYDAAGASYEANERGAQDAPLAYLVAKGFISTAERDAIWPVHLALKDYAQPSDPYDHEAILQDLAWKEVCRVAATARTNLLTLVTDPAERRYFENVVPSPAGKRWP